MRMSVARGALSALAGFALLGLAPLGAAAQSGVLYGRVVDVDGRPLPGAEVRLPAMDRSVQSDWDGTFLLPNMSTGLYYFGARKIGYHPVADLLRFNVGDTLDIAMERIEATKKLDTVQVQARADAAWNRELRRFDSAIQAARFGTVITEQDIQNRRPTWTADLFQSQTGFIVVGGGGSALVYGSRSRCTPAVFLDGVFSPGFRLNDLPPQFIKLLVMYRGQSSVPAQFQDIRGNANCGTIVIFTV